MTQRERRLAIILSAVIVAGGIFLVYQLVLRPLGEYGTTIATLESQVEDENKQLQKIQQDKRQLERWRLMSLPIDPAHPTDVGLARGEYQRYLKELMYKFGELTLTPVEGSRSTSTLPNKKPVYTPVDFNIRAKTTLPNLVQMLEEFQRTPLLHKIKSLTIDRPENVAAARRRREDLVAVEMTIEALVVSGAERRPTNLLGVDHRLLALDALTVLEHGPAGIALVPSVLSPTGPLGARLLERHQQAVTARESSSQPYEEVALRNYRDIAKKNIFQGMPMIEKEEPAFTGEEIEVTRFTYLTDITMNDFRSEAFYYIRTSKRKTRLRVSPGFNSFQIRDDQDDQVVVSGKVVKIESRDIYFQVGNNYYDIHIGQNFAEAMRRRLPETEVKSLGLVASAK
jgi:hypothetical protein